MRGVHVGPIKRVLSQYDERKEALFEFLRSRQAVAGGSLANSGLPVSLQDTIETYGHKIERAMKINPVKANARQARQAPPPPYPTPAPPPPGPPPSTTHL